MQMDLIPVGQIHSPALSGNEVPAQGMAGKVEIFPDYVPALDGIEGNSHLILLCWMHRGDRNLIQARARKIGRDQPLKGVFALRSPSRPNPISLSVVRLVGRPSAETIEVDCLDLIDGTPVLDIKPYQPGLDCVFSAWNLDRSQKIRKMDPARYRQSLIREAVNYHGEWCPGAAMAVRISERATVFFGDLKQYDILVDPGYDPCTIDSLIGITGISAGNKRLISRTAGKEHFRGEIAITGAEGSLVFSLLSVSNSADEILTMEERDLFCLTVSM